jgi:hypothetical protein
MANIAIIAAGLVTAFLWASAWPDLIVGLGIAAYAKLGKEGVAVRISLVEWGCDESDERAYR